MKFLRMLLFYYFPPLVWAGVIFYFSSVPDLKSELPNLWDLILRKIAHLLEFGILAALLLRMFFYRCQKEFGKLKERKWLIAAAVILSILYAFSDEFHQVFVPGREGALRDVGIDTIGILIGSLVYVKNSINKKPQW